MSGTFLMRTTVVAALVVICISYAARRVAAKTPVPAATTDDPLAQKPGKQTAVFAGGCFWGTQSVFERVKGVVGTTVGYAGGSAQTATYDQVTTETTGHAESVQVVYDPSKITYGQLLRIFFSVAHDPTQLNRQGPDVGTSYRSAIFYSERRTAPDQPGLHCAARRRACLSQPHRDRGDAAEGLLRRRKLPSALRRQQSQQSIHSCLRPPQDRGRSKRSSPSCLWTTKASDIRFGLAQLHKPQRRRVHASAVWLPNAMSLSAQHLS